MRKLINNEGDKLEDIFSYYKQFVPAFLTTALLFILLTVGFALLIVPGIIVLVNYSFCLHVLQENVELGTLDAFRKSKELSKGYRLKIGLFYLIFFLISVVVFGISLAISLVPNLIWGTNLILYASIIAGVFNILFIFPVFYASVTDFYDNAKTGALERMVKVEEEQVVTKKQGKSLFFCGNIA